VADEKGFVTGIHTGPFGRVETAEQTEVFGSKAGPAQECDGKKFPGGFRAGDSESNVR
jgi:hypothetical protein